MWGSKVPQAEPLGRSRWLELLLASALFALLFAIYISSPASGLWDARFAVLTSEAILDGEGFDLTRYLDDTVWTRPASADPHTDPATGPAASLPWQLALVQERLVYVFPPGTPVLSLPLVAALRTAGLSAIGPDGRYDRSQERWMQLLLASSLAALTALVIFRLARHELAPLPAAAVALLAGLGSSLWTVASRELWSQTWSALLLGIGWLELLRWEEGRRPRPWLLGAIASAAFWVRPSNAWIALAWTGFVFLRHRSASLRLVASGGLGLATYCAWSLHYWGGLFPRYVTMPREWSAQLFLSRLADLLSSTRHGLLVYSPILLAVALALWRRGLPHSRRPLAALGLAIVAGHLTLHAASGADWGIDGPRFQHDLIPILGWFGALAFRRSETPGLAAARPLSRRRLATALAVVVLAAASVLASIGGVYIGQRRMGQYRAELEAPYPAWDLRRLPQWHGVRALAQTDPPRERRSHPNRK
jgi:hypothetical protein